ncbi:winged helix DNA-binding domain-containing protein [Hymenobacter sp.]|jgi:hypothetical protein|uniref:winged helix DNA-binding domain-containing protein n=1 Tax=Hymenobacter sp. TaxID=1898978 RepID=UPI002EDB1D26
MEHAAIARQRIQNQLVGAEKGADPAAVVRWMGAMQAQDYGQVVWAVGLRTQVPSRLAVEQAVADKTVVLTWLMRGTIHFASAEDTMWLVKLFGPRLLAAAGTRRKQLELDQGVINQSKALFYEALHGGQPLTRSALMQLLEQAGIRTNGQRGYHLLWSLALEGFLCFGPRQATEQTFVLLEEWVPNARNLSREESLAELAARYFTSHGPATLHDFAGWLGLPVAEARQGLEAIHASLSAEKTAGKTLWMPATPTIASPIARLYLLPGFDEYFLGYKDRSAVVATEYLHKICPRQNGVFKPMVVVDGQIAGTWSRKINKSSIDFTANFFLQTQVTQQEVTEAAEQYCHFWGLPLGSVTLHESHPGSAAQSG